MNPYFCAVAIILYFCSLFQVFNADHSSVASSIFREPGSIATEALGSVLTLSTKSSKAGSVSSLTWQDYEFLHSVHEMGNRLMISSNNNSVRLSAFFPDEKLVETYMQINPFGEQELSNVVRYELTAHPSASAKNEKSDYLAGYLPDSFSRFFTIDLTTGELTEIKSSTIVAVPMIVATADGKHAMGIVADDQFSLQPKTTNTFSKVHSMMKWNTSLHAPADEKASYGVGNYLVLGNLSDVQHSMVQLRARLLWNSVSLANAGSN